jgi:organic hydroperoxide reductase OsmC/OhrA
LHTVGRVADLAEEDFRAMADDAKRTCPLSRALASTDITLDVTLES